MNTRTIALISVFILAAGIYALFVYGKGMSSFGFGDTNFAVKDTSEVSRMVLTRVIKGEEKIQISLSREKDHPWKVNDSYPAFQPKVDQMLAAIHRMQVKETLTESAQRTGKRFIETLHTRLDIYKGNKKSKTILIGTQTKDAKGTIMMLEGADTPYPLFIPGVPGYLNVYFPMELDILRENLLFLADKSQVKEFEVSFDSVPEQQNVRWVNVSEKPSLSSYEKVPQGKVDRFFDYFQGKIYAESFVTQHYPGKLRVLKSTPANKTIRITYLNRPDRVVHLYDRPENPNNYFGWVEGEEELITVQRYVIDKFLKTKPYFINDSTSQQQLSMTSNN